jgi:hypothetical protein
MSYVDTIRDQITAQIEEGLRNLDWIDREGPGIIRTALNIYFATVLHLPIPGLSNPFADEAIEHLHRGVSELRRQLKYSKLLVAYVGSPDTLRNVSVTIETKATDAARELAGTVTLGKLPSTLDSNWSDGEASEGYEHAVDGRSAAVEDISVYSTLICTALDDLADWIETYYLALLAAVVGLVVAIAGIVEIVLTLLGVVTAPLAVVGAIMAIGGAIAAGIGIFQLVVTGEQTTRSIAQNLGTNIPDWPRSLA